MSHLSFSAFRVDFCITVLLVGWATAGCWAPDSQSLTHLRVASPLWGPGEIGPLLHNESLTCGVSTHRSSATARSDKPAAPRLQRYPADRVLSPLTSVVIARLRKVVARAPHRAAGRFMKVGDSHLANLMTLGCFAPRHRRRVHLGRYRALAGTLAHFSGRLSGGRTSFDRRSGAARGGMSIPWVLRRRSSPLNRELRALNPRYAVISFGTNDMDRGTTPASAMKPYVRNLERLLDRLLSRGVIPIVLGLPPRTDSPRRARWAVKYNDVTRRIAESRQVLFINQQLAVKSLPRQGLAGDGVHANLYFRGIYRVCDFSAAGLRHGTNLRNLLVLQALDRLHKALGPKAPSHRKVVLSQLPIEGGSRDT